MWGRNFHCIVNRHGIMGLRCNNSKSTMMLCYRSPYASERNNMWLEKKMLALYTRYYHKVMWESKGQFLDTGQEVEINGTQIKKPEKG